MEFLLQTWWSLSPTLQWLICAFAGFGVALFLCRLQFHKQQTRHAHAIQALKTTLEAGEKDATRLQKENTDLEIERARLRERVQRMDALERQLHQTHTREKELQQQLAASQADLRELNERLLQERRRSDEKLNTLAEAEKRLSDAFKALSAESLKASNTQFLELAKTTLEKYQQNARQDLKQRQENIQQLTQPIHERLEKFDGKLGELEKARIDAYAGLNTQVKNLMQTQIPQLHAETAKLVKALRQPHVRGRWGEVQLRRVVEMAGMLEHCDFVEQVGTDTDENRLRPDMIVKLPGGRHIIVDAKTPVDAYLSAVEAEDEPQRQRLLARHAQQVRKHITDLGRKAYQDQFDFTPEFAILFVPGEAFFSAALTQDLEIIEYGAEKKVIPASPTTLIALLKAVAYGWQQEALAQNAKQIADLGQELYTRIQKLAEHWNKLGKNLDQAVHSYNASVGSLESRVLATARKFPPLAGKTEEQTLKQPTTIDNRARPLSTTELLEGTSDH